MAECWEIIYDPQDGDEVVFVGVHALRWRSEWGEPTVAFNRVDDPLPDLLAVCEEGLSFIDLLMAHAEEMPINALSRAAVVGQKFEAAIAKAKGE